MKWFLKGTAVAIVSASQPGPLSRESSGRANGTLPPTCVGVPDGEGYRRKSRHYCLVFARWSCRAPDWVQENVNAHPADCGDPAAPSLGLAPT